MTKKEILYIRNYLIQANADVLVNKISKKELQKRITTIIKYIDYKQDNK